MKLLIFLLSLTIISINANALSLDEIINQYKDVSLKKEVKKELSDAEIFSSNSELYYEIGGASSINKSVSTEQTTQIHLGGGAMVGLGYSCGQFNPKLAFKNVMNNFKDGVDDAVNTVLNTANAAISSLPSLIMQRAQPGLHALFKDYQAQAEARVELANKSCEQMEAEIAEGKNPYTGFIKMAKADAWKEEAMSGSDVVAAKKRIDKESIKNGVKSYGGKKKGGKNSPAMEVVADAAKAGFNHILGVDNPNAQVRVKKGAEMYKYFKTGDEAAQWAVDVVGEYKIDKLTPSSKVGVGLIPKVEEEKKKVLKELENKKYSKLGINSKVIAKIKSFTPRQQEIIWKRLVENIAINRVINKALILKRIFVSAGQDPLEKSNTENQDVRDKKIAYLQQEINDLVFSLEINNKLRKNGIVGILKASNNNNVPFNNNKRTNLD